MVGVSMGDDDVIYPVRVQAEFNDGFSGPFTAIKQVA
jgi:hypothetical protein